MYLSREEIEQKARTYFGDLGEEAVAIATAIAFAESGGDTEAVNDNYPRWQSATSPLRYDYGLMQINSVHGYPKQALLEPSFNMSVARVIYNSQGWNAWTSYRWGTYRQHLAATTPPEPAPVVFATPPPLELTELYKVVTDAFYPAYRADVDTQIVPLEYREEGGRTYRVYELKISEA